MLNKFVPSPLNEPLNEPVNEPLRVSKESNLESNDVDTLVYDDVNELKTPRILPLSVSKLPTLKLIEDVKEFKLPVDVSMEVNLPFVLEVNEFKSLSVANVLSKDELKDSKLDTRLFIELDTLVYDDVNELKFERILPLSVSKLPTLPLIEDVNELIEPE